MTGVVCIGAVPANDGLCLNCTRPTVLLGEKIVHKRGRWREKGRDTLAAARVAQQAARSRRREERERQRALGRAYAERIRAAELDPTLCDCGEPLEGHRPLPKPKPMGGWSPSWETDEWEAARAHTSSAAASDRRSGGERWR